MTLGKALINMGAVSPENLAAALAFQRSCQIPIGRLALDAGFLTMKQVFQIVSLQGESGGARFGEIAESLGFMTAEQVEALLDKQRESRPPIGVILLEREAITEEQLNEALSQTADVDPVSADV